MSITEITETSQAPETATSAEGNATIDLTGRPQPATSRPTFTITDAAAACAVSRKTITRKLGDLALHGAAKDGDGIWRIPVEALLAVGLHPGRSLPPVPAQARVPVAGPAAHAPAPAGAPDPAEDLVSVPRHRWDDLRIRLARAEAEAAERALALADARLALRALTAGPTPAPTAPTTVSPGAAADPAPPALPAAAAQERADAPLAAGLSGPDVDGTASRDPSTQLAAARSHAAQNGGYVPAAPTAARKRRWWHSR